MRRRQRRYTDELSRTILRTHHGTSWLEAFSDGVFAFAITLLIIEIGVPQIEGEQRLAQALRELWPS